MPSRRALRGLFQRPLRQHAGHLPFVFHAAATIDVGAGGARRAPRRLGEGGRVGLLALQEPLGVGGGGANAVDRLKMENLDRLQLAVINTDFKALST